MSENFRHGSQNKIWLFSDHLKWAKICIPLMIVVLAGIYYNNNLVHVVNSREYIKNLFNQRTDFTLCLNLAKIQEKNGEYYVTKLGEKFKLKNLPNPVKHNLKSRYSIKGEIIDGSVMHVKEIRAVHPRLYKIMFSGLTVLIVCLFFFFFFRFSNNGFVHRRFTKNA